MPVRPTYPNLPSSDVDWTISADTAQDAYALVTVTLQADAVSTAPDSWALEKPARSSSSVSGSGHTVTYTPDSPGTYVLTATVAGVEVARNVCVAGISGIWELVHEIDLTAESTVDIKAGGDGTYTLDCGIDLQGINTAPCSVFAITNGTGLHYTTASGSVGDPRSQFDLDTEFFSGYDDETDWAVQFRAQITGDSANYEQMTYGVIATDYALAGIGFTPAGANTSRQDVSGSTASVSYSHTGDDLFCWQQIGRNAIPRADAWVSGPVDPTSMTMRAARPFSLGDARPGATDKFPAASQEFFIGVGVGGSGTDFDVIVPTIWVLRRIA